MQRETQFSFETHLPIFSALAQNELFSMIERSWGEYFRTQNVLNLGEEKLLHVFELSLRGLPLPAPWSMWCDKEKNAFFFTNSTTGETTWMHPLHHLFLELAGVGRRFVELPTSSRPELLAALNRTWESEARAEILRWHPAFDDRKVEYFYNVETKAVMWERPVDALLPGFYLKKEFLKNLNGSFGRSDVLQPISQLAAKSKSTLATTLSPTGGPRDLPTDEGYHNYLVGREILNLPADELLLQVFQSALRGAPLPAPWSMWLDKTTRTLFFTNNTTGETQWTHPLHRLFQDLAAVGRRILAIPVCMRVEHLAALSRSWDSDARGEILKWQTAHEDGKEYYYNIETNEVMWERPVDAVLPAFYLRKQFLKKLSLCHQEKLDLRRAETGLLPQLPVRRDSVSTMPSTATTVTSTLSTPQSEDPGTRLKTGKTRRASRKLSDIAQLDDNWEYYLTTQGIVNVPGEENLLRVFQSVLKRAPMPAPWKIWHDRANNRFFFVKKSTGNTSWQHPLNSVLLELAGIARHHFTLPESRQADHIVMWGNAWDAQADVEIAKWNAATDENDMEYFFNTETNETMWERPEDVVLPELFLRRQFLARLGALQSSSKEIASTQKESESEVEAVPSYTKRQVIRATVKSVSPKPKRKAIVQHKGVVLRTTRPPPRQVEDESQDGPWCLLVESHRSDPKSQNIVPYHKSVKLFGKSMTRDVSKDVSCSN